MPGYLTSRGWLVGLFVALTGGLMLTALVKDLAAQEKVKRVEVWPLPLRQREPLPADQALLLQEWFEAVGPLRTEETFGALVTRAARFKLGVPYSTSPQTRVEESLQVRLDAFECVSFVESALSLSRCIWSDRRDEDCFLDNVEQFRYRDGKLVDYSSRLHYFSDWLWDNARRHRIWLVDGSIGGSEIRQTFSFMTDHPRRYSPLSAPEQLAAVSAAEDRLSSQRFAFVSGANLQKAQSRLETGDIVGIVSNKYPGILIGHVGFILRYQGRPRLLHASSYHRRVVITIGDIASYVRRRPDRRGVMVARPLPPWPR